MNITLRLTANFKYLFSLSQEAHLWVGSNPSSVYSRLEL